MIGHVAPSPVIVNMAISPAITNDGPLPEIGYVSPMTPTPAIENVAGSSAVANDGPLPVIGYVAPAAHAPVIENVNVPPVNEFMAPALGASNDGPSSEIDDLTRCLNDLKKQGIYHPLKPDLEGRVAALQQSRGH